MKYNSKNILLSGAISLSVLFLGGYIIQKNLEKNLEKNIEDKSLTINDLTVKNNQLERMVTDINKKVTVLDNYNKVAVKFPDDSDNNIAIERKETLDIMREKQHLLENQIKELVQENKKIALSLQSIENIAAMNTRATSDAEQADSDNSNDVTQAEINNEEIDVMEQLAQDFQQQEENNTWSIEAMQSLEQTIAANTDKVQLTQSTCRSAMCRLDFVFSNTDSQEEDFRTVMDGISGKGERFFEINQDGTAIVYIAHQDHRIFE